MKIKDLCIGDGKINEYTLDAGSVMMIFQDYTDTLYEIMMENCTYISVKGSVGFSLSDGKFKKTKTGDIWFFYDEDGEVIELHFNGYSIRKIS